MPRPLLLLLVPFLISLSPLRGEPGEFVLLRSRSAGMFSIFMDVIALLDSYEAGNCEGLRVAFGTTGPYYDPQIGYNWWNYYCAPIHLGKKAGTKVLEIKRIHSLSNPFRVENKMSREKVHGLIQKYLHVKPEIQNRVDSFVQHHFNGYFVIGVHYRGTDKVIEAPRVDYQVMERFTREELRRRPGQKCKIFVATDEEAFLTFMKNKFGQRVCYNSNAERSQNGDKVHGKNKPSPYKIGKHALMDCLLLSRTHLLLRTSSNLSLFSTYFNPYLPVINVSVRH